MNMKEFLFKNMDNYILIQDNQLISSNLTDGIEIIIKETVINININNQLKKINLQVVYNNLNNTYGNLKYNINKLSKVEIIESHQFHQSINFERTVEIEDNAEVNFLSLNEGFELIKAQINEQWIIHKNVVLNSSYSELSDCDIEAKYHYNLVGDSSKTYLKMAALSQNKQRKKYQIALKHKATNTYGKMDNYGVAKHQSHLYFEGIGKINKDMHLSETHQTSKIIVFDKECNADVNPLLLIDNYDVKASHAAGVGKIDPEQLYYLQSRGLSKKSAMHLITIGYLLPVVDSINNESIKDYFIEMMEKKVGG